MNESKCLRFLSFLLVMVLLLSSFSLSSFAISDNLINPNMTDTSDWSWQRPVSYVPSISYDSSTNTNTFDLPANLSGTTIYRMTVLDNADTFIGHTYRFSCSYKGYFENAPVAVELQLHAPHQVYYDTVGLCNSNTGNDFLNLSVEFNILELGYIDVTSVTILFKFTQNNNNQHILYFKDVSLVDEDIDNSPSFWNTLWQKIQELKSTLTSGFSAISGKVTQIFDNLGTWFSDLWNNISDAFSDLTTNVQNFFIDLGEDIEEFFDKLRDYILYFQHPVELDEDGIPVDEHGNPIYENIFDIPDFFETIEDWIETLDDSKADVNSGANQGIQKISLVTGYLNSLTAIPIISILVIFGMVVIVIKKVLG